MKEIGVIDLMITAHQHQTIIGNDFETVYVQAGQDAQELVHVKIKFKTYELVRKEDIESTVINLSEFPEDQELLETTYYDRKALEHWSKDIVSENKVDLQVNGLEDLLSSPHPFIQLLHDSLHLAYVNNITCINVPKMAKRD